MPVIAGSVCTHLLPWGCHTIMELVLAALPVETTGALLRTGAMAEIAAILFVRAVMPELAALTGFCSFPGYYGRQIILSKCFFVGQFGGGGAHEASHELEVLATALGKT